KAIELSKHPRVILEALLETGRQLVFLDPERARQLLQLALQLAENVRHLPAQARAKTLLKNFGNAPAITEVPLAQSSDAGPSFIPRQARHLTPHPGPDGIISRRGIRPQSVEGRGRRRNAPACSIIIPTFNNLALTRECLQAIRENTAGSYEVLVVDNASTDGTREWL